MLVSIALLGGCAQEPEATYQARSVAFTTSQPDGAYQMSGPISIKLNIPGIIKANVSSPNMGILGSFIGLSANFSGASGEPGNFAMNMDLLGAPLAITGTWSATSGNNFKVVADLDSFIAQIQEMGGTATITKNTFTGKVLPNGQLKGAFGLGAKIGLQGVNLSLNIAAKYTAKPVELTFAAQANRQSDAPVRFVLNDHFALLVKQVVTVANTLHR